MKGKFRRILIEQEINPNGTPGKLRRVVLQGMSTVDAFLGLVHFAIHLVMSGGFEVTIAAPVPDDDDDMEGDEEKPANVVNFGKTL